MSCATYRTVQNAESQNQTLNVFKQKKAGVNVQGLYYLTT